MSPDDIVALNEQIAGMARAGLPLDQGLESLAKDMGRGRLRSMTEALTRDLRAGCTLAEALDRQGDRVPPYYASLVVAGVQSGRLPEVLTTLTTYARTVARTRSTILEALLYPAVVMVLGLGLLVGLALFILPQFDQIYSEFGLTLPPFTSFVMVFGRHPVETIAIPLGTILGIGVLVTVVLRLSPRAHRVWSRLLYVLPVVGQLIRSARLAAFSDLLATLVEYDLPLPAAFQLAAATCADPVMAAQGRKVAERLTQGQPLADAFRGRGLLPEWVAWMAGAGERQGSLAPALRQIAAVYYRQVDSRAAILRTVLPSLVVIVSAGFLTGFFAIALMLPMVKLLEGLSK